MKVLEAEFVTSAAGATGLPREPLPHVALVGRSNVGKSSLINALVGRPLARASAAPGKTRLINVYRVKVERGPRFYFLDLPGYGFARGGSRDFAGIVEAYFEASLKAGSTGVGAARLQPGVTVAAVIQVLDARHPGLPQDVAALDWLDARDEAVVLVATKIDKLTRAERMHALRAFEHSCRRPVLPVSAVTGEGLDALWKQIVTLANTPRRPPDRSPTAR